MLAFGAVVMPRAWMEASHEWLGLGMMPDGPVINFMIRHRVLLGRYVTQTCRWLDMELDELAFRQRSECREPPPELLGVCEGRLS